MRDASSLCATARPISLAMEIRMRGVTVALSAILLLAACGDNGSSTDAPAKAPAPKVELTAEQ